MDTEVIYNQFMRLVRQPIFWIILILILVVMFIIKNLSRGKAYMKSYEKVENKHDYESSEVSLEKRCPRCGELLGPMEGKYGNFLGCTNPKCHYTELIINKNNK